LPGMKSGLRGIGSQAPGSPRVVSPGGLLSQRDVMGVIHTVHCLEY
jgi:hypothetical protein